MSRIAFVGLGSMGAPLARLIARAGLDLIVYDPFPEALGAFAGVCERAGSARDAANGADILCICVRDEQQVRDVLFGAEGAAQALAEGSLVLIHSTIAVSALRDLATMMAERGVTLIDVPVSRTRQTTEDRFVFAMLGGEADAIERARPVVAAFATDHDHMGPLGAGMATKIANNMVTWLHIVTAVQAADMAVCDGVALDKLMAVMRANGNLTPTMNAVLSGKFAPVVDPMAHAHWVSQGGIGEKDLALAIETAGRVGIDRSLLTAARDRVGPVMSDPVVSRGGAGEAAA